MPQLDLSQLDMIEMNYTPGEEEDLEDVFIATKSSKVTSMSALFADDVVGAEGQMKREEGSGHTHQILGKALTLSLGTESGYETEGGTEESDNWQGKSIEIWTNDDVMDWIYAQAILYIRDLSTLRGENFQQIDGQKLSEMKEEEFLARDAVNGPTLYRCLQDYRTQYISALSWHRKNPLDWSSADVLDWIYYGSGLSEMNLVCLKGETFQGISGRSFCSMTSAEFEKRDEEFGIMLFNSLHSFLDGLMEETTGKSQPITHQKSSHSTSSIAHDLVQPCDQPEPGHWGNRNSNSASPPILPPKRVTIKKPKKETRANNSTRQPSAAKRKTRKASSEDVSDDESSASGPPSKIPKQSSKTRLWKFMRDLLDNPEYNPECIRWENKDEGIFRIVAGRSKVIADLWGKIKNNPTMTFDKLGRSLRWCRANNGKFSAVPRDGKFPRKLCFRLVEPDVEEPQRTGEPGKIEWNPPSDVSGLSSNY